MQIAPLAAALALSGLAGAALAQAPAPPAAPAAPAAAPSAAAKLSVKTTRIAEIVANPKARAALEAALPEISQYYEQIADMTLAEVAPMSQGALDEAKLNAIQASFDAL